MLDLEGTGLTRRQIVQELGYDPDMLGEYRYQCMVRTAILVQRKKYIRK